MSEDRQSSIPNCQHEVAKTLWPRCRIQSPSCDALPLSSPSPVDKKGAHSNDMSRLWKDFLRRSHPSSWRTPENENMSQAVAAWLYCPQKIYATLHLWPRKWFEYTGGTWSQAELPSFPGSFGPSNTAPESDTRFFIPWSLFWHRQDVAHISTFLWELFGILYVFWKWLNCIYYWQAAPWKGPI